MCEEGAGQDGSGRGVEKHVDAPDRVFDAKSVSRGGQSPGQHDRTRGQLLDFQIALKKRMEEETRLQLRPYIALLGLVNFPEHF